MVSEEDCATLFTAYQPAYLCESIARSNGKELTDVIDATWKALGPENYYDFCLSLAHLEPEKCSKMSYDMVFDRGESGIKLAAGLSTLSELYPVTAELANFGRLEDNGFDYRMLRLLRSAVWTFSALFCCSEFGANDMEAAEKIIADLQVIADRPRQWQAISDENCKEVIARCISMSRNKSISYAAPAGITEALDRLASSVGYAYDGESRTYVPPSKRAKKSRRINY